MKKLTRVQLYKWVWSCPVTRVAGELGISGSALAKKCKAHDVPTPGRGYWRQVEQGKSVQRALLPNPDQGHAEVPVKVSEERAVGLDELLLPFAGSAITPAAHDKSKTDLVVPEISVGIEVPKATPTSDFVNDIPNPQMTRAEAGGQFVADPADIVALATFHEKSESARRFIEAVREAGQDCDAPTKAVLILWAGAARDFLFQRDPIIQIIEECRSVALGRDCPEWWISVQKGTGEQQ